ncbi:unnamed protein product [Nezara viridula]|uniref:FYVE-type domain-containing protein n=1 Tax=Nezara viridula TaxID=85310 RepID=A0A9P0E886_NEZVI|nr:unnamed protein product [Nezara viridula]
MDKFAVDIEKVLDEFEYNEGREESVTPVVIKNHSLSRITQKPLRPPAASYRRPTFEPINLADADFAAANFSPSPSYNTSVKQSSFKETRKLNSNHVDNKQTVLHSPKYQNEIDSTDVSPIIHELKDSTIDDCTEINKQILDNLHSDDKPDLLDSNILNPSQIHINGDETVDANNQLPDITSVRSTVSKDVDEIQPVFDLIKPHISVSVSDEEELPPLVDVGSVIKEDIPDLHVRPISFDAVDDISEGELEDYLSNLEVDANDSDEGDSVVTDTKFEDACEHENASSSQNLNDYNNIAVAEDTGSEATESNMGLSGSSNKNEKTGISNQHDSSQKIESGERGNSEQFSKIESEKASLLQEFPPETSYGNKKCELDNINCRSCTNNVTSSSINLAGGDNLPSEPQKQQIERVLEEPILEPTLDILTDKLNMEPKLVEQAVSNETQVPLTNNVNEFQNFVVESRTISENMQESTAPVDNVSNFHEVDASIPTTGQIYEPDSNSLDENKPARPSSLTISTTVGIDSEESPTPTNTSGNNINSPLDRLGKYPPFWVPDTETDNCMQCHNKFTVIRRRHHCRACGLVLCSKCCNLKAPLEYMEFMEARVCQPCFNVIYRVSLEDDRYNLGRQPNPNNPMEYCSTIPPLQQAASTMNQPPPSVLVPTGVLKREGKSKSDVPKQVIFSDGIRPGGDLTELDGSSESSRIVPRKGTRRLASPSVYGAKSSAKVTRRSMDPNTQSFISSDSGYPPIASNENGEFVFHEDVLEVTNEPVKFAINYNLFVIVKKVKLECCVNRECWSACSDGLACVGQDEVGIILECLPDEVFPPQDIFHLINTLHLEASKGTTVTEMSYTPAFSSDLLGSKDHGGFIYIRPTFQCTTNLLLPAQPYLIAILVHRWETPWARLFPLRLILRLGAEYRYYPCPLVSIRNRPPLYTDIGHTVMKILVDFRKYSYSLPTVRGLLIHMEDRQTTILFPRNRYDQVIRAINNSNESVLAFGANLSLIADSHLVCIQGTKDENIYHTQAINIHNKPRRVTGASFVVFNGTLKTAGLSGKSSIMEDGLMVHLPSDSMVSLRNSLREMKDYKISCGPNDEETVVLQWTADDINFNIGVKSYIDGKPLDGVPSIRVHNGTDHPGSSKIIRWTEVFILQTEEDSKATDPIDISRVSESLARATCIALVPELDSLSKVNLSTIAVRANIHPDNVSYEAGGLFTKLPSHYMNLLDEELVPVIHQAAISSQDTPAILELVFRIMNHP